MHITEENSVFDLLAIICGELTDADERKCAIKWETATVEQEELVNILNKFQKIISIVSKASMDEDYTFSPDDINIINRELKNICSDDEKYLLALQIEQNIDVYSDWQAETMLYQIEPLNSNYQTSGIKVYPKFQTFWNTDKSERNRENRINKHLKNYMIVREVKEQPFKLIFHYWNDTGLLRETKDYKYFNVALIPVMDNAQLNTQNHANNDIQVNGIINQTQVEARVIRIFNEIFSKDYSIIMFPEALGTDNIVAKIKEIMKSHPEKTMLVFLPSICQDGDNTSIIMGPGGIELFRENKATPFIKIDNENNRRKEYLNPTNDVHILVTKEIGNVAFPICAELLEHEYYAKITDVAYVDTILCSSFTPGIRAFENTMIKGIPKMILTIWVNTCSAKSVSRKGTISDTMGIVQLPDASAKNPLNKSCRKCDGSCGVSEYCYFDIKVVYQNGNFRIQSTHFY